MLLVEAYILLDGMNFLLKHSEKLCLILDRVVGQVRPRGASYIMLVFEALLQKCPTEGGYILSHGGITQRILINCAKNFFSLRECEEDQIIIYYLTTCARMLIASPELIDQYFPLQYDMNNSNKIFRQNDLISLYFKKIDSVSQILWKKVWVMLFISLLPPTASSLSQILVQNMDQVLNLSIDYVYDEQHHAEKPFEPAQNASDQYDIAPEVKSEHYELKLRENMKQDDIYKVSFRNLLKMKMESFSVFNNGIMYKQAIESVEPLFLRQLEDILNAQQY